MPHAEQLFGRHEVVEECLRVLLAAPVGAAREVQRDVDKPTAVEDVDQQVADAVLVLLKLQRRGVEGEEPIAAPDIGSSDVSESLAHEAAKDVHPGMTCGDCVEMQATGGRRRPHLRRRSEE